MVRATDRHSSRYRHHGRIVRCHPSCVTGKPARGPGRSGAREIRRTWAFEGAYWRRLEDRRGRGWSRPSVQAHLDDRSRLQFDWKRPVTDLGPEETRDADWATTIAAPVAARVAPQEMARRIGVFSTGALTDRYRP